MNGKILNDSSKSRPLFCIMKEIEGKLFTEQKTFKTLIDFFCNFSTYLQFIIKYSHSIEDYKKRIPDISYSLKTTIDALSVQFNNFAEEIMAVDEQLQKTIITKLTVHEKSFNQNLNYYIKQKENLLLILSTNKQYIDEVKKNYINSAKDLESAQESLSEFVTKETDCSQGVYEKVKKRKITNVIEKKQKAKDLLKQYKEDLKDYNRIVNKKYDEYEILTKRLLKLDEDRIELMKSLFGKHTKYMEEIGKKFITHARAIGDIVDCINARNDIELFISEAEAQSINSLFVPLKFEKYNYKDPSLEIIELESDREETKEMRIAFEEFMTSTESLSIEQKATLIQYLHKNEGRGIFIELLSKIKNTTFIPSFDYFKDIGDLINSHLNVYLMDQQYDQDSLQTILNVSKKIYTKHNNKRKYIYSLISDNPLWRDMGRWSEIIEYAIQQNMKASENKLKKRNSANNTHYSIKGKAPTTALTPKALNDEKKQIMSSSAFNVLGQFTTHFGNFHVKAEEAKKAIKYYGSLYKVEKINEIAQKFIYYMPLKPSESNKRKNLIKKINMYTSDLSIIISLAVKYLHHKADLLHCLLLSKRTYEAIKVDVFKQVLNIFKLSIEVRSEIWASILEIDKCESKYDKILNLIKHSTFSLPLSLEQLIVSDVQRAFPNTDPLFASSVKNILRAYAHYNTKVEYFQGMHSIVGFLLYFFKDESKTLKAFVQIFKKFKMNSFFTQDMLILKQCFFQLDRLLFHYYPFLAEHLRNEGIEAYLYSPTWFLTFFTDVMNYTKNIRVPPGLIAVWDSFIIDGWKTIFKTCLFIFSELQDELLNSEFEQIMQLLRDLKNCSAFDSEDNKLRIALTQKSVTRRILHIIEQEYDELMEGQREEDIEEEFPDASFKKNMAIRQ